MDRGASIDRRAGRVCVRCVCVCVCEAPVLPCEGASLCASRAGRPGARAQSTSQSVRPSVRRTHTHRRRHPTVLAYSP